MKSKYSDEKHKFTIFGGNRIIASAQQAPRGAIPAKPLFCFYDALVNHNQACFVIIRLNFIIISYWFLLLSTCHFVIRHKPIIIRHLFIIITYQYIIIRHNFSYQAPIYYQALAKFSETGILHHPFSKVPWGGALCGKLRESPLQVDFFSPSPNPPHTLHSFPLLPGKTCKGRGGGQAQPCQPCYQGLFSSLVRDVIIQSVGSFIDAM